MVQGQFDTAMAMAKPVVQILEIQNEQPENWLPDQVVKFLNDPAALEEAKQQRNMAMAAAAAKEKEAAELFVDPNAPEVDPAAPPANLPTGEEVPIPTSPEDRGMEVDPVVPKDQVPNPMKDSMAQM